MDCKCQPAANTWDGDVKLSTGGYELGPIKPWLDVSFLFCIFIKIVLVYIDQSETQ